MLGHEPGLWAYNGDDGKAFTPEVISTGYKFGQKYEKGAIIGCGVNFEEQIAFFTCNGELIGMFGTMGYL